jgi:TPR repeat protein
LALLALPAWAGPLEDANAAYERGDYAAALPLYRTLAERGDGSAQSRLGSIYLSGRGTRRNFTEALKWSRRAAALGFADAQHNLGTIYLNGFGVEQDLLEAARSNQ